MLHYRFVVVAVDSSGDVVSTSKAIHVATKGKRAASNPTKVRVPKKALKRGKSLKLKAKALKKRGTKVKAHAKLRYESTDASVATVSAKGVVKGVKRGKCSVYAYAQNGAAKKVKVVVK